MTTDEKIAKYVELCHAMQSGVAIELQHGSKDTEPKHLRVGINTALVDAGSLCKLLVDKGVITHDEYIDAIYEGMKAEVERYEERLTKKLGVQIRLG